MEQLKGSVLIFLGGVLLVVGQSETQLVPWLRHGSRIFLALTLLGVVLIVSGLVGFIGSSLAQGIVRILRKPPCAIWHTAFAQAEDLSELHELYASMFGNDVPSLEQMRKWHECNPRIFLKVSETDLSSSRCEIVASAKLVPLKKEAVAPLESERVSGTGFMESHITRREGTPYAWYVGDLVSLSRGSASTLMGAIIRYLALKVRPDTPLYARPLTDHGMHYIRRFGFRPVQGIDGQGRIYKLGGAEASRIATGLHAGRKGNPLT